MKMNSTTPQNKMQNSELTHWSPVLGCLFWSLIFFMDINLPLRMILPNLFETYDIRVDILPAFIGWFILIKGLNKSSLQNLQKKRFLWLCGIAFIFAVFDAILSPWLQWRTLGGNELPYLRHVINIWRFYQVVSELLLVWFACSVIAYIARVRGRVVLDITARLVRIGYLLSPLWFLTLLVMSEIVVSRIGPIGPPKSPGLFHWVLIAVVVLFYWFFTPVLRIVAMVLMWKGRKLIAEKAAGEANE